VRIGRELRERGDGRAPGKGLSTDGIHRSRGDQQSDPVARVSTAANGTGNSERNPSCDGVTVERAGGQGSGNGDTRPRARDGREGEQIAGCRSVTLYNPEAPWQIDIVTQA